MEGHSERRQESSEQAAVKGGALLQFELLGSEEVIEYLVGLAVVQRILTVRMTGDRLWHFVEVEVSRSELTVLLDYLGKLVYELRIFVIIESWER